jgi:RNA polymerase sigma-70 factor (ECF subfamily)
VNNLEPEWLTKVQIGNPDAFADLVEHYQRPVYNLSYRMLGDPYEAEDAAQETFLRAYQNIKRYDQSRPFSTWLLSIAAHYCIDQIRKRRFNFLSLEDTPGLDVPDHEPGPEATLFINEEQQRVRALLNALKPQDRAAVILRYWYDLSYEEIAEMLSMTESAVKSRLHRARLALVDDWQAHQAKANIKERTVHESPAL